MGKLKFLNLSKYLARLEFTCIKIPLKHKVSELTRTVFLRTSPKYVIHKGISGNQIANINVVFSKVTRERIIGSMAQTKRQKG